MGNILTSLGMRYLIGLGGPVKLLRQLKFKGANDRTIELDPPVWDDLRTPVNSFKIPTLNPPSWTAFKGGQVLAFSDQAILGNENYAYFNIQISHKYKEGEDVELHAHWVGEDATAGNVYWRLTYSWANQNEAFPSPTTVYVESANGHAVDTHNYADFGVLDGDDKEISSMLVCSISRHSSNVLDTFTSKDAYLLEVDIHYPIDTIGSRQEVIK